MKLIYIDPPYNTGNDFIYEDDFADPYAAYLKATGQMTEDGDLTTSKPEVNGRRHSRWLSMMYPRVALARQLLADDGLIFVSIDDNEFVNLSQLMSELFGEENFIANFIWKRKAGGGDDSDHVASEHEYIVCYARDSSKSVVSTVARESAAMTAKYNRIENGRRFYYERLAIIYLT